MSEPIARAFDAMAADYERLEPWYEHLYSELHAIVEAELLPASRDTAPRALDAGCGSGFQTALLERLGYRTHGVDLSPRLLELARDRTRARLAVGDLQALPYPDGSFDAVACCGSTLSFVPVPAVAVREIGRVLRRGGRLLLECEHKWSLDLAWGLLGSHALGYGVSRREMLAKVARPLHEGFELAYPGYPPIRLFTRAELSSLLTGAGLRPLRAWGLHSVTNVIPSTVLHRDALPRGLARLYSWLRSVDSAVAATAPARWLANSLVVLAAKV
jgi:SAM-dependent methyltransferase